MIIKKKEKKVKKTPQLGDTRWVRRFALLPVPIDANKKLWLEEYFVLQTFCECQRRRLDTLGGSGLYYVNDWVDEYNEDEYLKMIFENSDVRLKEV